jgi:hypothetical protein
MASRHEIWLDDERGNRLLLLDEAVDFSYTRSANNAGSFTLTLAGDFDRTMIQLDGLVEFWRAAEGGALRLMFLGMARRFTWSDDQDGQATLEVSGPGINQLLSRRIVAYAAGSAQAEKTDQADDMMKAIVAENLGSSATDTDRDWSGIGLSVAADLAAGPSITKAFSRRNVLAVLKEIAEISSQNGTELYFDLEPGFGSDGKLTVMFTTHTGQPGIDRTAEAGAPVYFGHAWGNLAEPRLVEDYSSELTVVYAGGQGVEEGRTVAEVEDTARSGASAWGRIEGWKDSRNETTADAVEDDAQALLNESKPTLSFSGKLLDSPQARYGIDWNWGDRVTCEYRGYQFDGLVRVVSVAVGSDGQEEINAKFETGED